jgi:hypothetical protein
VSILARKGKKKKKKKKKKTPPPPPPNQKKKEKKGAIVALVVVAVALGHRAHNNPDDVTTYCTRGFPATHNCGTHWHTST